MTKRVELSEEAKPAASTACVAATRPAASPPHPAIIALVRSLARQAAQDVFARAGKEKGQTDEG